MPLVHHAGVTAGIVQVLQAVVGVIDMSNPDHPSFADSAADCLDELLRHDADIRASLASIAGAADPEDKPARFINFYKCPCGETFENSWPGTCDDRCEACGTTCSPATSIDC